MTVHLEDYRRHLQAKNDCPRHVAETVVRVRAILDGCAFKFVADLDADRVGGWLAEFRRNGRSVSTSNSYLRAVKGFSAWLGRYRTDRDPLKVLACLNPDVDRRHERRSVAAEEYRWLLKTIRGGRPADPGHEEETRKSVRVFRGLCGPDRFMLYTVAGYTGLRCGELASVTPESFDVEADPPTITVQAAYSKRRRRTSFPCVPS